MSGIPVPPHNIQIEESLLGALLLNNDMIGEVLGMVSAADFYRPAHATIYAAILDIYNSEDKVDPATVTDALTRSGDINSIGGPGALISLQANTPASSNAPTYAKRVKEWAALRSVSKLGCDIRDIIGSGTADNISVVLDQVEAKVTAIRDTGTTTDLVDAKTALDSLWNTLDERMDNKGKIQSPIGFPDIDKMFGGLKPGSLYVLAARPGQGKTSLAGAIALNVVERGEPVLFCTMEMSTTEVWERIASNRTNIPLTKFRDGSLTDGEVTRFGMIAEQLRDLPFDVFDKPAASLFDIRAKARRVRHQRGKLGLIVVDYLQLMSATVKAGRAEARHLEVAEFVRGLKELARELDVPVLALSQLNRGVEGRVVKVPQLHDLRESGEIEQAANVVMFIHREQDLEGIVLNPAQADIYVAKNRSGDTGRVTLNVDLSCQQWRSVAPQFRTVPA